MLSLSLCLLACSLLALSACGTKPPEPEPQPLCPPPQIPSELLRKSPKPEPLTNSTQASARTLSWPITSATQSSARTLPRSWTL
ncbi:hypothetical protein DP092_02410 [Pseudomonas sp. MDMC224]|nr:hypothetical protein DP092_02410 [Pseudomonas sp. MDMC224]